VFEDNSQYLYHADKDNFKDYSTKYETKEWNRTLRRLNKVDHIELVGYSSTNLTPEKILEICEKINQNRIFNNITNNCQQWIISVLNELVNQGYLSHLVLEELKINNEITPLHGW
jgi:hypothetical protein